MRFRDRRDAGKKLAKKVQKLFKNLPESFIVSLLRGGAIVGETISKELNVPHLLLPVAKIPSPLNPEYALGALCFDKIFLRDTSFERWEIKESIKQAKEKFLRYLKDFEIKEKDYDILKDKTAFIVDDGIATGSTVEAAALFLKTKGPKKIILLSPVAPADFSPQNFDNVLILHKDPYFSAVSQFYEKFEQVEKEKILNLKQGIN